MPTYEHICTHCSYEWEEFYSIKADPPTVCPKCKTEGKVKRLISGGSGKGIVTLTGHELNAKIKSDAKKLKRAAGKNEKMLANLVGEERYHQNKLLQSEIKKDLKNK